MNRCACVIFDLDGTLTRTNELIFATFNHVAQKYVGKQFTPDEIVKLFGPPEEFAIEHIVGTEHVSAAMEDFYQFYEMQHARMAEAYDGIQDILEFLRSRGIRLAVFTGKGTRSAEITLQQIGLRKYFDLVVTGNDVENHKPSADGIRKVMETFRLKSDEVLMVGDAVADVKASREASVRIAAAVWDSYGRDQVVRMDVDYIFESVADFGEWLRATIPSDGKAAQ
jgi:pyrophosphatase PpaX